MIALTQVETVLAGMKARYERDCGAVQLLHDQRRKKEADLARARADLETWRQVQVLFGKVSEYARAQLKTRIEETVTAALQAVFGDEGLSFRISLGTKNSQPAAEWEVVSQYGTAEVAGDPESSRGGGVSDVVSLALRLALLELTRPKMDGPVLLDEIGKHVSGNFVSNVAYFLRQYAEKTGRQVILITHQTVLAESADVSYLVSQTNGISEVTEH